jgi:photosystem II stability/assembly factor-like uncharacterized protein
MREANIRKKLSSNQIIYGSIVLFWTIIFFGLIFLRIPFQVYLGLAENPWDRIDSPTYPEYGVTAIDFVDSSHGWVGGEGGIILASTDGGQSWIEQNSGIDSKIMAIDFSSPQIGVAIGELGLILITHNGGENWTVLETAKYPSSSFGWQEAILWDSTICDNQIAWVLGTKGSFFQVNITDNNWTFISHLSLSLFDIDMLNRTHGWAAGGYGNIVRTQDGWQSFEKLESGVSTNFRDVFFWNEYKGWIVGFDNTILATIDGGESWYVQYKYRPFLAEYGSIALTDIYFLTDLKGWAVGSYGIHYTENGGKSWYILPNTGGQKITFANDTHGWSVNIRKDRSFFSRTGGIPPFNETLVNSGFGVIIISGILISFLILGATRRIQH